LSLFGSQLCDHPPDAENGYMTEHLKSCPDEPSTLVHIVALFSLAFP
jgi:hypothetical protein